MGVLACPVTAIDLAAGSVLCGRGGVLFLYGVATGSEEGSVELLPGGCIHGFTVDGPHHEEGEALVVAFGQKRVCVFLLRPYAEGPLVGRIDRQWSIDSCSDWVHCVRWVGSSRDVLAVGFAHNFVELWSRVERAVLARLRCAPWALLYSMALWGDTADALVVAAGTIYNDVVLWRANDSTVLGQLCGHQGSIYKLAFNATATALLSASDDRTLILWTRSDGGSLAAGQPIDEGSVQRTPLKGHTCRVWDCKALQRFLVSCGEDNRCIVWTYAGERLVTFEGHRGRGIRSLACSERLGLVVTGGHDSTVKFWQLPCITEGTEDEDTRSPAGSDPFRAVPLPGCAVKSLVVGPLLGGGCPPVFLGTGDGAVLRLAGDLEPHVVVPGSPELGFPQQLCISGDSRWLFVGYSSGTGRLHCLEEPKAAGSPVRMYEGVPVFFAKFAAGWGPGPPQLITSNAVGHIDVWQCQQSFDAEVTLQRCGTFQTRSPRERVATACLLPAGQLLMVGDVVGNMHVFPANSTTRGQVFTGLHSGKAVRDIVPFAPSADQVLEFLSIGLDGSVNLFAVQPEGEANAVRQVTHIARDTQHIKRLGGLLAILCEPHSLRIRCLLGAKATHLTLWDYAQGRALRTFPCGQKRQLIACSISQASVTGTSDGPPPPPYAIAWVTEQQLCVASNVDEEVAVPPRDTAVSALRSAGTLYHGAEVHHVQWLRGSGGAPFLLSGCEDTTLSIVEAPATPQSRSIFLHGGHTSSVRCAAVHAFDNVDSVFVFSAGGREELSVWKVQLGPLGSTLLSTCCISRQYQRLFHPSAEAAGSSAVGEEDGAGSRDNDKDDVDDGEDDECGTSVPENELRRWQIRQLRERGSVHYRVLSMATVQAPGGCFLLLGCSDGLLKVFRFSEASGAVVPVARSPTVASGPILCLAACQHDGSTFVITGGSAAHLGVWSIATVLEQDASPSPSEGLLIVDPPVLLLPSHQSGVNAVALEPRVHPGGCLVASGGDDQALRLTLLRMQGGPPEVIASVLVDRISSAGVRSIACDEHLVFLAASDQRVNVFRWEFDGVRSAMRVQWLWGTVTHVQAIASISLRRTGTSYALAVAGQGLEVVEWTE
eukprot:EG_transcript_1404